MRIRARRRLTVLAAAGLLVVPAAGAALRAAAGPPPGQELRLVSASGALSVFSDREGRAILSAGAMLPGTRTVGTAVLQNQGGGPAALTLEAGPVADVPGPGRGRLSDRLRLQVSDMPDGASAPSVVYDGSLQGLSSALALGTWAAGERHAYRFVVTFPDGGPNGADNAYQGAAASVDFTWRVADGATAYPPADAPYDEQVRADVPLAFWPLNGDAGQMPDTIGPHPGSFANGVALVDTPAPGGTRAASFDGRAAYAYVNGLAAPTTGYTLEAWLRPVDGSDMAILEHGGGGSLAIRDGHVTFRHGDTVLTATGPAVTPGVWHHVVATWDGASGTARLYVDGVPAASAPATTVPSGSATVFVGRGSWVPGPRAAGSTGDPSFFRGELTQVGYYASPLSAARAKAHFDAGARAATPDPGAPVATTPAAVPYRPDTVPAPDAAAAPDAPATSTPTTTAARTQATPSAAVKPACTSTVQATATRPKSRAKAKTKTARRLRAAPSSTSKRVTVTGRCTSGLAAPAKAKPKPKPKRRTTKRRSGR